MILRGNKSSFFCKILTFVQKEKLDFHIKKITFAKKKL